MDNEDLRSKLAEVLGREAEAARKEQENRERMKTWIKGQGRPAFDRLQPILHELRAQAVTNRWEDSTGTISFSQGDKTFAYTIRLAPSPKGITGTTHIVAPGQEERTHGPLKDIVNWTEEQIIEDFLKGLDSWHPEKK